MEHHSIEDRSPSRRDTLRYGVGVMISLAGGMNPFAEASAFNTPSNDNSEPPRTPGGSALMNKPDIRGIIHDTAVKYGIDPKAFLKMAQIESRLNPKAFHPKSRAAGLFQFIPSTARFYGLANPFDCRANADAAARLWNDNAAGLLHRLGRQPSAGEIYLAHQQGLHGASRLLLFPDHLAATIVGVKAVMMNRGRANMTASEFARLWTCKFD